MYSAEWFDTFAATVPAEFAQRETDGLVHFLPIDRYRRIVDVGCGIGRLSGPLSSLGYAVTGIDINVGALRSARCRAPAAAYVALDQQHIGRMRWQFDAALFMWNSLGFVGRDADLETVGGVASILRRGGRAVFDLYHPDWLRRHERSGEPDRGATSIRRWMRGNRCCHQISYRTGRVDDIQFDVYQPDEIRDLCVHAGLQPIAELAGWDSAVYPSPDAPRYQVICERPG